MSEDDGSVTLVIVKQGNIDRDVEFSFTTNDGTASSIGKLLEEDLV